MDSYFRWLSRPLVTVLAIAVAFIASAPDPLAAQPPATQQPDESAEPAAAPEATEPVLVVTVASVSKLMEDVNYLTSAVGQPQAGGMFTMMAGTFTQGVDQTRPIGLVVPLVNNTPEPIALIPTSDVKQMLKGIEAQTGPADELDDGTLVIAVGANTVYLRQLDDWAVVARRRELIDLAPADPMALFRGMGNDYDLAVRVDFQKVPAPMRDMLVAQMRQGFEQAMSAQPGPDADDARKMAEGSLEQLEQLIQQTEQLKIAWNIDPQGKQVVFDFSFTGVEGTDLAKIYEDQEPIPSRFASVIRPDAAGFYHAASSISPAAVEQARTSIDNSLAMLKNALASQGELSEQDQQDIAALVDRIAELTIDTFAEGKFDAGALLLAQQNELQFVFGSFVADGNEVAQIAKDLAKKVENEPDAPRFEFDRSTYKNVSMHLIEADVPEDEEEAREIFGETLQVHLGTAPKAVFLAVGRDSEPLMKKLIDASEQEQPGDRPLGQMQVQLLPIFQYIQSVEANDTIAAMIDALARAPDPGQIKVVGRSIPNGQESQVAIGEGVLQAIGAAIRQSQQAQQGQNGQF